MPHNAAYEYLGWKLLFSTPPPPGALQHYLRRLPKRWLLVTLTQIATSLFNSGQYFFNPEQQALFVLSLKRQLPYCERLARLLRTRQHCILLHPAIISTLVKYAVLYASETDDIPFYAFDHLIRSIIIANDAYGTAHRVANAEDERLAFLPYELESMLESHENLSSVIARYYQFMKWTLDPEQSADPDFLPVPTDFFKFFAMSYEDYAAAAFGLMAPFTQRFSLGDWQRQIATLEINTLTSTLSDRRHFMTLLNRLSMSIEQASTRLSNVPQRFGLCDLRPFIEQPLLQIDESVVVCPYQGFLRNALGQGLYFALFDKYREQGQQKHLKLARLFGRFLEQYLFRLVEAGAIERNDVLVFPEQFYQTSKGQCRSSDIVVIQGNTAVFMDVTRKRFKLDKTLCERDVTSLDEDINQTFVQKAKQITESIAAFRSSAYSLGGVEPSSIASFIPVIVTEQDLPQLISLPHLIHSAIDKEHLLRGCESLQILAADDVEALYRSTEGTACLVRILSGKCANEAYRHRDLATYLYDNEQALLRPSDGGHDLPGYREFFDTIVMPKMREWGLQS